MATKVGVGIQRALGASWACGGGSLSIDAKAWPGLAELSGRISPAHTTPITCSLYLKHGLTAFPLVII
jgi:hypothetical protein